MIDKCLINFLESWDLKEEIVWSKKIILGDREIDPLNKISIFCNESGEVAFTSIKPLAWFITELDEEYILLFDEEGYNEFLGQ